MISPMLPTGTPLVVVWTSGDTADIVPLLRPEYRTAVGSARQLPPESALWVGQRVVLAAVSPCEFLLDGWVVEIAERPGEFYPRKCFELAALPRVLSDLQTTVGEDA